MGKTFEKQIKTIEDQGERQAEVLKDLNLKDHQKQPGNDYGNKFSNFKEREIFKEKSGRKISFSKKDDPLTFLNEI